MRSIVGDVEQLTGAQFWWVRWHWPDVVPLGNVCDFGEEQLRLLANAIPGLTGIFMTGARPAKAFVAERRRPGFPRSAGGPLLELPDKLGMGRRFGMLVNMWSSVVVKNGVVEAAACTVMIARLSVRPYLVQAGDICSANRPRSFWCSERLKID